MRGVFGASLSLRQLRVLEQEQPVGTKADEEKETIKNRCVIDVPYKIRTHVEKIGVPGDEISSGSPQYYS